MISRGEIQFHPPSLRCGGHSAYEAKKYKVHAESAAEYISFAGISNGVAIERDMRG